MEDRSGSLKGTPIREVDVNLTALSEITLNFTVNRCYSFKHTGDLMPSPMITQNDFNWDMLYHVEHELPYLRQLRDWFNIRKVNLKSIQSDPELYALTVSYDIEAVVELPASVSTGINWCLEMALRMVG